MRKRIFQALSTTLLVLGCTQEPPAKAPETPLQQAPVLPGTVTADAGSLVPPSDASAAVPAVPPVSLTHEDAVSDVKEFIALLEATHPDCYTRFGGRIAFNLAVQRVIRGIPSVGLKTAELGQRLQQFISTLSDGHTHLRSPQDDGDSASKQLAIRFGVAADGMFVSATDLPELDGARGYRLVSYGGVPVADLVRRVGMLAPIENDFGGFGRLVDWLRRASSCTQLLERDCAAAAVELGLRSPAGKLVTKRVAFGPAHGPMSSWRTPPIKSDVLPKSDDPFLFKVWEKPKAGYLRVGTVAGREAFELWRRMGIDDQMIVQQLRYVYSRSGTKMPDDIALAVQGVPSFYEHAYPLLDAMKNGHVETLIVDLRGDDGGCAPTMLAFLYELFGDDYYAHPFKATGVTRYSPLLLQMTHKTLADVRKENNDNSIELGGYVFDEKEGGSVVERREKEIETYADKAIVSRLKAQNGVPYYRPSRILVISDEGTFSAASDFLYLLHDMGAELVGVPPRQSPNAFIDMTSFELSRSKLAGSISHNAQMYMPESPAANVFPMDYPVTVDVFSRFGFDDDAPVRFALSIVSRPAAKRNGHD